MSIAVADFFTVIATEKTKPVTLKKDVGENKTSLLTCTLVDRNSSSEEPIWLKAELWGVKAEWLHPNLQHNTKLFVRGVLSNKAYSFKNSEGEEVSGTQLVLKILDYVVVEYPKQIKTTYNSEMDEVVANLTSGSTDIPF